MAERFSKVTPIQDIILHSNRLSRMPQDTQLLTKLDRIVKSIISGQLADHCQIGKLDQNVLIYYVDSPVWAYTLKMSKLSIIQTLHSLIDSGAAQSSIAAAELQALRNIEDIQVRVRPSIQRPVKFKKKSRLPLPKLSKATAQSIEETASTFQDEELANVWRAFAQNHVQPD